MKQKVDSLKRINKQDQQTLSQHDKTKDGKDPNT
jgi:hypothetical protein